MDSRDDELRRLRDRVDASEADNRDLRVQGKADAREIADLREEAGHHDEVLLKVRDELAAAELELGDLRAVRDALTPPKLPERPGLTFAASFLPASHRVSGDFYIAAEGPENSTVMVVGDVVGKGPQAARRAAFVRTTFATTARFSDDPCRLLEWANVALTERAGYTADFVTAACVTFRPETRRLRWAFAGHPPPLWLGDGDELSTKGMGAPLGIDKTIGCSEGTEDLHEGDGVLMYTDGLVEARRDGDLFGVTRAGTVLREMAGQPADAVVARLRDAATEYSAGELQDDLCLLAVRAS